MKMNNFVFLAITGLSTLLSPLAFADELSPDPEKDFDPIKGYSFDKEYYDSLNRAEGGEAETFASKPYTEDLTFSVYSTGGYTYQVAVHWTDPQGKRQKVTRNHFTALLTLKYTIPKGSRDATIYAATYDGFYKTEILSVAFTNELAESHNNFLDFRFWGTTFSPKWALKD